MAGVVSASNIDKLWPASVLSSKERSISNLLWDDERLRAAARTAQSLSDDSKKNLVADLSEYTTYKFGLDTHAHNHNRHRQLKRNIVDTIIDRCDEFSKTDTGGQHIPGVTGLSLNGSDLGPNTGHRHHRLGNNRFDLPTGCAGSDDGTTSDNLDRSQESSDNELEPQRSHRHPSSKPRPVAVHGDVLNLVSSAI